MAHAADPWIAEQWQDQEVKETGGDKRSGVVTETMFDENGALHCKVEDEWWCPAAKLEVVPKTFSEVLEEWEDKKKTYSIEGSRGVENLCKLVRGIGYRDSMNRMQFAGGCLGDLLEFFEDNPGAIEAVKTWISDQNIDEWREHLEGDL